MYHPTIACAPLTQKPCKERELKVLVSFIIPHMGREKMLLQTLDSISAQSIDTNTIEVIVVSKNLTVSDELDQYDKLSNFKFVTVDKGLTISQQRNVGAEIASGQYFAFVDADIELAENWTSAMLKTLHDRTDAKLVSAIQKNSANAPPLERLRTALSNAKTECEVKFLPGRNLFLHKDTFSRTNGFPEHLITCEDYVFTQRVSEFGKLFYTDASNYIHIGEDKAFYSMAKKEIWRGQSNIKSIGGRKIPLREVPSFIAPPIFTFGILLSFIFLAVDQKILAFLCMSMSAAVIGLYSLRLYLNSKQPLPLRDVIFFYLLYFPARTIGTIKGILL